MKYFVISDVHSFYAEMMAALNDAGFEPDNPNHTLISCGDLLDRGDESVETLEYINSLPRKILIRGNHEDLLEECIARRRFLSHDLTNGTASTVAQLAGHNDPMRVYLQASSALENASKNQDLNVYLKDLKDFVELGDYVFVHGWIPLKHTWEDGDFRAGSWDEARWLNGMQEWADGLKLENKTVVCGHWHTSWGHSRLENNGSEFGEDADFSPFKNDGILAIDACTAHTHRVNCVVLNIPE